MRAPTLKVVGEVLFSLVFGHAMAGITEHEATCAEIGFQKKTPAYGECVLELDRRKTAGRSESSGHVQTQTIDGSTDEHQMCLMFGFVFGTAAYSDCRLKISMAKQEQAKKDAAYQAEMVRYEEEKRRYDARVAEYEREKERQKGLALLRFGAALAGGTSPYFSENLANANRQMLGLPPAEPQRPSIQNFTITNRNGMTNCTVVGNMINCF